MGGSQVSKTVVPFTTFTITDSGGVGRYTTTIEIYWYSHAHHFCQQNITLMLKSGINFNTITCQSCSKLKGTSYHWLSQWMDINSISTKFSITDCTLNEMPNDKLLIIPCHHFQLTCQLVFNKILFSISYYAIVRNHIQALHLLHWCVIRQSPMFNTSFWCPFS